MRLWVALVLMAQTAGAEGVTSAEYAEPTTRYDHGILGDAVEWGALRMVTDTGRDLIVRLPDTRVFEDTEPRVADVTGDGLADVVVVETDLELGARLAVYGPSGLIAANAPIGQTHRWLAPAGIADLDGDGRVEIAFIDRPHLAKVLRVVQVEGDRLVEIASAEGLTNHRIGEPTIGGGIRDCGQGPEIITANADWTRIMASSLRDGAVLSVDIGPFDGDFAAALACR